MRLKSVGNIAKITKSMKMIASTKMTRAQRLMGTARVFGNSAGALLTHVEVAPPSKPVFVAVSSDRGLCGGIHSSITKAVKKSLKENPEALIVTIGQKGKAQLSRQWRSNIVASFESVAKATPTWLESAMIADAILKLEHEFDGVDIVYNNFKSVISYEAQHFSAPKLGAIEAAPSIASYEVDEKVLENYAEFAFANSLFWAIAEGSASELSARRTAMENATKNADEMIQKLTLTYNRQRQAVMEQVRVAACVHADGVAVAHCSLCTCRATIHPKEVWRSYVLPKQSFSFNGVWDGHDDIIS
ncbi:MAG: hypothetical protein SGCHY_001891 [Lobulomycetales sp.]